MNSSYSSRCGLARATLVVSLAVVVALGIASPAGAARTNVICAIKVSPTHAVKEINTTHSVVVTVLEKSSKAGKGQSVCNKPAAGQAVRVRVLAGPNSGVTATLTTDAAGQATYSWTSAHTGLDIVLFSAGSRSVSTRVFWIDKNGGGGPYGERFKDVLFSQNTNNAVAMYLASRCHASSFDLLPAFIGADLKSARLTIDGKKYKSHNGVYRVDINRLSKGKHTLRLLALFTGGNPVSMKTTFARCGEAARTQAKAQPDFTG